MNTRDLNFQPMYVVHVEGRQRGLFRAHKGRRLITAHRKAGDTPFVAGSRKNNSITDFADTPALFPGGWLTLIYNGDGGTGHARYQPMAFSASDDVIALEPLAKDATEPALLLISSLLTQQCVPKFGFGYKLTLHRLGRQKIMVPVIVDEDGDEDIDWDGLTSLGRELLSTSTTAAVSALHTDASDVGAVPELNFEAVLITDVFETMNATTAWYDKSKLSPLGQTEYPFISRTRANNGVDGFCSRQAKAPEPGNAITIALDTQVVAYQPVPFYTSQNIQVLRHRQLTEAAAMVLVAAIDQQMGKFSWGGNGATLGRLRKTRIMVPTVQNDNGNHVIDWEGMSRYAVVMRAHAERAANVALGTDLMAVSP
jgi:hypothetical protein